MSIRTALTRLPLLALLAISTACASQIDGGARDFTPSEEQEDVIFHELAINGHVAITDIEMIEGDKPRLPRPTGEVALYDAGGKQRDVADISEYTQLAAEGRGRVLWGSCFEVVEGSHPFFNRNEGLSNFMCEVSLVRFRVEVTGDVYILGSLLYQKNGELVTENDTGILGQQKGSFQMISLRRNARLAEFDEEGEILSLDAVLQAGNVVILDREGDRSIELPHKESDTGTARATFMKLSPNSFDEIVVPQE